MYLIVDYKVISSLIEKELVPYSDIVSLSISLYSNYHLPCPVTLANVKLSREANIFYWLKVRLRPTSEMVTYIVHSRHAKMRSGNEES